LDYDVTIATNPTITSSGSGNNVTSSVVGANATNTLNTTTAAPTAAPTMSYLPGFFNGTVDETKISNLGSYIPLAVFRRIEIHVYFNPISNEFEYCPWSFPDNINSWQITCVGSTPWYLILDPLYQFLNDSIALEQTPDRGIMLLMIHAHCNIMELMNYDFEVYFNDTLLKIPEPSSSLAPALWEGAHCVCGWAAFSGTAAARNRRMENLYRNTVLGG